MCLSHSNEFKHKATKQEAKSYFSKIKKVHVATQFDHIWLISQLWKYIKMILFANSNIIRVVWSKHWRVSLVSTLKKSLTNKWSTSKENQWFFPHFLSQINTYTQADAHFKLFKVSYNTVSVGYFWLLPDFQRGCDSRWIHMFDMAQISPRTTPPPFLPVIDSGLGWDIGWTVCTCNPCKPKFQPSRIN